MLFSDFTQMLYPFRGDGKYQSDFVVSLIGNIIEDDVDERCALLDKKPDYLTRIFNGSKPLPRKDVTFVVGHMDKAKFEAYMSDMSDDATEGLQSTLASKGYEVSTKYEVPAKCAEIFAELLTECANSTKQNIAKTNIEIADELVPQLDNVRLPQVPLATVYVKDGKIHIGGSIIKLSEKLVPPADIEPHEQVYVTELFAAYTDAEKTINITSHTLPSYLANGFLINVVPVDYFILTLLSLIENIDVDRYVKYILQTAIETKFKEETVAFIRKVARKQFDV